MLADGGTSGRLYDRGFRGTPLCQYPRAIEPNRWLPVTHCARTIKGLFQIRKTSIVPLTGQSPLANHRAHSDVRHCLHPHEETPMSATTPDRTVPSPPGDADESLLAQLGYKQELHRRLSG